MKTAKKILAMLALIIITISCSNDDAPVIPIVPAPVGFSEQNPLAGYLAASGFNQTISELSNGSYYEFGFSFKPTVKGKMTAIIAKFPDDVSLRVTIWDKLAGTVYRDGILSISQTGVEFTQAVDIPLEKDKEYMITVNTNDWYRHAKTDGSNATYPYTLGNIVITGYGFKSGTDQIMPNTFPANYYSGDLSFKFLQTE